MNDTKTVVTFDFDGTLGNLAYIQKLAMVLLKDPNNEVHIVTRRYGFFHPEVGDEMTRVYAMAKSLGIDRDNVHFTNREYKYKMLTELKADVHYDDDPADVARIRRYFPSCHAFLVFP